MRDDTVKGRLRPLGFGSKPRTPKPVHLFVGSAIVDAGSARSGRTQSTGKSGGTTGRVKPPVKRQAGS
ncbi:MAG: hypothetical protein RID91_10745 [Azospirillaceae bacterium]